jgi:hypothetical protein
VRRWLQIVPEGRYIRHSRTFVVGVRTVVPEGRYIRHSRTIVDGVCTVVPKCRAKAAHRHRLTPAGDSHRRGATR